jgi:hypothetical protein
MQTLTKEEMLEIKGGDWADVAKGSLCSTGLVLAVLILRQPRQFCRLILSGWRNWRRSGTSSPCNRYHHNQDPDR